MQAWTPQFGFGDQWLESVRDSRDHLSELVTTALAVRSTSSRALIAGSVIELRRLRTLVAGDRLGILDGAAVFEVSGDARCVHGR
jgi:hypothetical protein